MEQGEASPPVPAGKGPASSEVYLASCSPWGSDGGLQLLESLNYRYLPRVEKEMVRIVV